MACHIYIYIYIYIYILSFMTIWSGIEIIEGIESVSEVLMLVLLMRGIS
jgi:hypothetical protein